MYVSFLPVVPCQVLSDVRITIRTVNSLFKLIVCKRAFRTNVLAIPKGLLSNRLKIILSSVDIEMVECTFHDAHAVRCDAPEAGNTGKK